MLGKLTSLLRGEGGGDAGTTAQPESRQEGTTTTPDQDLDHTDTPNGGPPLAEEEEVGTKETTDSGGGDRVTVVSAGEQDTRQTAMMPPTETSASPQQTSTSIIHTQEANGLSHVDSTPTTPTSTAPAIQDERQADPLALPSQVQTDPSPPSLEDSVAPKPLDFSESRPISETTASLPAAHGHSEEQSQPISATVPGTELSQMATDESPVPRPDTPDPANLSDGAGGSKKKPTAAIASKKFSSTSINRQFQAAHAAVPPTATISRTVLGTKMPIAGSSGSAKLVTRVRGPAPVLGTVVRPVAGIGGARPVNGASLEGPWRPIAPRPPSPKLPSLSKEEEIRLEAMRGHHPEGTVGWDEDEDEDSFAPEYVEFADGTKYEIAKEVPIQQQLEAIEHNHKEQIAASSGEQVVSSILGHGPSTSENNELRPPRPPKPDPFSPARKSRPLEPLPLSEEKSNGGMESQETMPSTAADLTRPSHTLLTRPKSNPFASAQMGETQASLSKSLESSTSSTAPAKPVWAPLPSPSEHPLPDLPTQAQIGLTRRPLTPPMDLPTAPMQRLQDELDATHLQDPVPEPEAVEIAADAFVPRSPPRAANRIIATSHPESRQPEPILQQPITSAASGPPALWVDKDRDIPAPRAPKLDRFRSGSIFRPTPNGVSSTQPHPHPSSRPARPVPNTSQSSSQQRAFPNRSSTEDGQERHAKDQTPQMHPAAKSVVEALRLAASDRKTVQEVSAEKNATTGQQAKARPPRADPFKAPVSSKSASGTAGPAAVTSDIKEDRSGREHDNWRQNAEASRSASIKIRGAAAAAAAASAAATATATTAPVTASVNNSDSKEREPIPAILNNHRLEKRTAAEWDRILAEHSSDLTNGKEPASKMIKTGDTGHSLQQRLPAPAAVTKKEALVSGPGSKQHLERAMDTVKNAMQRSTISTAHKTSGSDATAASAPMTLDARLATEPTAATDTAIRAPEINAVRSVPQPLAPSVPVASPSMTNNLALSTMPQPRPPPRWKVNLPKEEPAPSGPIPKRSPWDRMKPSYEAETTSYDDPIPKEWLSGIMEVALPAARFYKDPVPLSDIRF